MKKVFVPPIKSQGIKTKIVPWILENAQLNEKGLWIEPFMGTGVVGFNARPKNALFSDLNPHIITFYKSLKLSKITPGLVRKFLEEEGHFLERLGGDHYYKIRDRFNKYHDPLDFLFLSRACFNGMIRFNSKGKFNVPFCHKPNRFSKSYVTKIANQVNYVFQTIKLNNWNFECADFRELIRKAGRDDFIYCDPPYFGRHVDYYNAWTEKDEHDLSLCLKSTQANFILSTWHGNAFRQNTSIQKYWSNFTILTKNHFYHVGAKEKNRNPIIEALVMNYSKARSVHKQVYSSKSQQMILLEKPRGYRNKRRPKYVH